jgi:hypothetical protein
MKFITLSKLNENLRSFFNNIIKPYIDKELAKPSSFTMTVNKPEWWDDKNTVVPVGSKVYFSNYGNGITVIEGDGETSLGSIVDPNGDYSSILFVGEVNGDVIAYPYGG